MQRGRRVVLGMVCALSALTMGAAAPGQAVLTVTPEGVVTAGEEVTVTYSDPSRAGRTIMVLIDNGGSDPEWDYVVIDLDERGTGSTTWRVPEWFSVVFTAPGAESVSVLVSSPHPETAGADT